MRLQALDLIRFIAALAVVLYHYLAQPNSSFPQLAAIAQFGYLGVPLFFMISGFVIAASAEQRSPLQFVISRAARLYPAYWIAVLFTSVILWLLGSTTPSALQILANLTMLNDYIGIANIDGVYWTLQVELKFYACVFLLMTLRLLHLYHFWLPIWVIVTLIYLMTGHPSKMGWVINPGYSCYFISGICLYLIWKNKQSTITNLTLGISTLLCIFQTYHQASSFIANNNAASSLIASVLVLSFHGIFLLIAFHKMTMTTNPIYPLLGGITYPLYLLHNQVGKLFIEKIAPFTGEGLAITLTTLVVLFLSYLVYRFAEPTGGKLLKQNIERVILLSKTTVEKIYTANKKHH
jgi:peptidoglycan/LPS O-acetylase OafA/YrhL